MRKQYIIIAMIAFILVLLGTLITAFLLDIGSAGNNVVLGTVHVSTELYYEKGGNEYPASEVVINPTLNIKKKGVYQVNVVDRESVEFIENVRMRVVVESDVDTYIRIKLLDQLVITTVDYLGNRTEIPIIAERTEFYYDQTNWYYNGPTIIITASRRSSASAQTSEHYFLRCLVFPRRSLQHRPLGYSIRWESGRKRSRHRGPQENWGLNNPCGRNMVMKRAIYALTIVCLFVFVSTVRW